MANPITTKEQQRAEFALNKINSIGKIDKETANFFVGLPTMLLTNGVGQTLVFLLSKKDKKHAIAFKAIKDGLKDINDDKKFIENLNKIDQKEYLNKQNEALAISNWLKRYARAFEEEK
jgi:CRISPR-associated protein Cmr5